VISAVVPTWGGRARLERNLGGVAASLEAAGEGWEIVVVDDGGGALEGLAAPARVVTLPENRGYGPAVNAGAAAAKGDYLLVLNDDVRLEPGTVAALRACFPDPADPTLFAAVPSIRSPLAACGDEGGKTGSFEAGLLEIREVLAETTHPTLYPVGCCFLCPRAAFLDLQGYDDAFAPFFWEDVDLGYRAWARGLRTVHVPGAVCDHEGSATLKERRTLDDRERISFRNRVLFHLRNLRDPKRRAASLGAWAAFALFETRPERLEGLAQAFSRDAAAPQRRGRGPSDAAILDRVAPR
jgi:GT2 family glycosyltransferase